jgi:methionyl-tRNA formyltransferase
MKKNELIIEVEPRYRGSTQIIFFGTPRFAEIVLDELIKAGLPPTGVICNPDRPVGRKHIITPPPTKKLIERLAPSATILQPERLDAAFEKTLAAMKPDLFVVAAYAKIIPESVLALARLGTIGVHPSLLPKYRGASPIQSAILGGEAATGVSLYLMDAKMDHGPILASGTLPIRDDENYLELEDELAHLAGRSLTAVIPAFLSGNLRGTPQSDDDATFTKKFTTQDGFIAEGDLKAAVSGDTTQAVRIDRMIRAFNPEPGAWTVQDRKRIKLLAARIENGALRLTLIRPEGGSDLKFAR